MKTLITSLALTIAFYCSSATHAQAFKPNTVKVSVENEDGSIKLSWNTQREINTRFFYIERSTDGTNFTRIATVNAGSSSVFPLSYSYIDAESINLNVTYTYRVVLVTMDGAPVVSSSVIYNQNQSDTIAKNIVQQ